MEPATMVERQGAFGPGGAFGPVRRGYDATDRVRPELGLRPRPDSDRAGGRRRAFEATLSISNESADPIDTLENVNVSIVIKDAAGNVANNLFGGLEMPTLTNITNVTGTGFVSPLETVTAMWLILPTDQAAPSPASVEYFISGQFSYTRDGTQITVPLFPVRIVVFPDASLFLNYYLQGQVFGDNPFTIEIEPAEPFSLGLLVTNAGFGPALDLRITSGQPQIVENESGLLIAFQLIGAQVGTQEIAPSLTVDLGNIPAGGHAVARWLMTSTLQGKFIEYNASFEHVNGLNNSRLSVIRAIDIFELNHVIKLDDPVDDGLPDFLVNDPPAAQQDELPDVIHSSDGAVLPVAVVLDAVVDGPPTAMDMNVVMSANVAQPSWNYFRLDNPGTDQAQLMQAVRTSPLPTKTLTIGDAGNVWTTHRLLPVDAVPTFSEDRLYLVDWFDAPGPVSYTLTFDVPPPPCQAPSSPTADVTSKVRYLSVEGPASDIATAIRVTFVDLPAPFDAWNGVSMWLGEATEVSELSGKSDMSPPTFSAAGLQCDPFFANREAGGLLQIFHEGIVAGGRYEIQAIHDGCDPADGFNFSAPLSVVMSRWGDVVGSFDSGDNRWTEPDGLVSVASDVVAILDKFKNAPSAPTKARADLEPGLPDLKINITDVTRALDAFSGASFPFMPGPIPCPN